VLQSRLGLAFAVALTMLPLVQVSGDDPFRGCAVDDPAAQTGHFVPDSAVEPRMAVAPHGHLAGAFQQDRWSDGGARGIVAGASGDGGRTWRSSIVGGLTLCSGGPFERASDPWVSFAPDGSLYLVALVLGPAPNLSGLMATRSADGGSTFDRPSLLVLDNDGSLNDKESITADPTDPSGRLAYVVWDRYKALKPGSPPRREGPVLLGHVAAASTGPSFEGPAKFTRTTDGGRSWEVPRVIYDPGIDSQTINNIIVVLPDGTLVNSFTEHVPNRNPDGTIDYLPYLSLIRSTDKGVHWSGPGGRPFHAALMEPARVVSPKSGAPIRTAAALADLTVDGRTGALYAVWEDSSLDPAQTQGIAFALSTDGGASWSMPIKINGTPTNIDPLRRQAFTPSVQVASDGTVGVTYYDFRNTNPLRPGAFTDYFFVSCHPQDPTDCADAAGWGGEQRLTDASFDMEKAPFAEGFFVGDYESLGTDGTDFLSFFSKGHAPEPASIFFRRVRAR
jgi:hypothetical protein